MSDLFTRNIQNVRNIKKQPFKTNDVNDILEAKDGQHYIRRRKDYHGLTDNIKSINGIKPNTSTGANPVSLPIYYVNFSTDTENPSFSVTIPGNVTKDFQLVFENEESEQTIIQGKYIGAPNNITTFDFKKSDYPDLFGLPWEFPDNIYLKGIYTNLLLPISTEEIEAVLNLLINKPKQNLYYYVLSTNPAITQTTNTVFAFINESFNASQIALSGKMKLRGSSFENEIVFYNLELERDITNKELNILVLTPLFDAEGHVLGDIGIRAKLNESNKKQVDFSLVNINSLALATDQNFYLNAMQLTVQYI